MRFKQQIWLLPIMTAVVVSIGLAINTKITTSASTGLERVESEQYPMVETLRSVRSDYLSIQETLQQAVSEGDKSTISKADERAASVHTSLQKLGELGEPARILSGQIRSEFDSYYSAALSATNLLLGEGTGDTTAAIKSMQEHNESLGKLLNDSNETAVNDFKALLTAGADSVKTTLVVSIIMASVTMTVLWVGSWIVIGKVFSSLGGEPEEAVTVVRRIATGDFTQPVALRTNDNNSLLHGIASLQERLGTLIRDVHRSSATVDNAANDMNSAVNQLSDRTSSQAASLEETASSMEEMTATVKQNADNARQANELAVTTRQQAEAGGTVVNQAINAMAEINSSSRRIADIISVIDEIAFQTNLLALNAAVEAARAGEQGRGFAVVASEVRNLAQRSATAAREIKTLINESVSKVQDGSRLVNTSGERLNEIVSSVKKVADIIGDISAASQEQARGLDQVNSTVAQLDHVTQQNSAMVSQASSVADNVAQQARRLLEIVSLFRIDASGGAHATQHGATATGMHEGMSGNAAARDDWRQVA